MLLLAEDERSLSRALTAILDIMMPRLDGLTVLRRLRAAGNRVPVLLLTARGEVEDAVVLAVGILFSCGYAG